MQEAVGGLIEIIRLSKKFRGYDVAIVNEEGKLRNLPHNELASSILAEKATRYHRADMLNTRGNVIFTTREQLQ